MHICPRWSYFELPNIVFCQKLLNLSVTYFCDICTSFMSLILKGCSDDKEVVDDNEDNVDEDDDNEDDNEGRRWR